MVRSTKEIYEALRAKQADFLHLSGVLDPALTYDDYIDQVNSNSKVAEHSHWLYQFAYHAHQQEVLQDAFRAEVQALADTDEIGTDAWWRRIISEFQVFDEVVVIDGKTTYNTIDPSKRIVKRVSATTNTDGRRIFKVAKESSPGVFEPLDTDVDNNEYQSLLSYLKARDPLGVQFDLINLPADKLQVSGNIYYDPILDVEEVRSAVVQAINDYLDTIEFNGVLYVQRLTDYIQKALGVVDLDPLNIVGISGSSSDSTNKFYKTVSGYMVEDPDNPWATTYLNFIPFVKP